MEKYLSDSEEEKRKIAAFLLFYDGYVFIGLLDNFGLIGDVLSDVGSGA